jgi:hypothetical protein
MSAVQCSTVPDLFTKSGAVTAHSHAWPAVQQGGTVEVTCTSAPGLPPIDKNGGKIWVIRGACSGERIDNGKYYIIPNIYGFCLPEAIGRGLPVGHCLFSTVSSCGNMY